LRTEVEVHRAAAALAARTVDRVLGTRDSVLHILHRARARDEDAIRAKVESLLDTDAVIGATDTDEGLGPSGVRGLDQIAQLLRINGAVLLVISRKSYPRDAHSSAVRDEDVFMAQPIFIFPSSMSCFH